MKGKQTTKDLSKTFFNFRLFIEGLKRLRVIGIAVAILMVTVSALVPAATWISHSSDYHSTLEMGDNVLCVPVGLMTFLAPFFFYTLFSFLQKRKESDFFHAIPYTRTCVYVSFTAAALAFVFIIQLACALTAGTLWSIAPRINCDLGSLVRYTLISMLGAAMLSSFMMLARTLSGTAGSCMLLFVLFASFTRIVAMFFLGCMETIRLLPTGDMWDGSFFAPAWFLPFAVFEYLFTPTVAASVMYTLPNILYSLVVTAAVYTLAGVIYKSRRSEMAGNPAPGKRTQTLFRVLFTMPLALLIPFSLITTNQDVDLGLFLIIVVAVLLVYFLYELITTKRARNMLKAIPGLGIVAAACILFSLVFLGYRSFVINDEIEVEDVKTVSVHSSTLTEGNYQRILLNQYRTDDPEVVRLITERYNDSLSHWRVNYYDGMQRIRVPIRLKSGRTLERRIYMGDDQIREVKEEYRSIDGLYDAIYRLPKDKEITGANCFIEAGQAYYIDPMRSENGDFDELMRIFREEYDALSPQQQEALINNNGDRRDHMLTLRLNGIVKGETYADYYTITSELPRTQSYLLLWWSRDKVNYYSSAAYDENGDLSHMLKLYAENIQDEEFAHANREMQVSLYMEKVNGDYGTKPIGYGYIRLRKEKLPDVLQFFIKHELLYGADPEADVYESAAVGEDTYAITLTVQGDGRTYKRLYINVGTLVDLTEKDLKELFSLLGVQDPRG